MFKNLITSALIAGLFSSFVFANVEIVQDDALALKSYSGVYPCQDCKGINTTLSFKKNKEFILEKIFIKDNITTSLESGSYEIQGDRIVTKNKNNEIKTYIIKGQNIYLSDPSGNIDEKFKLNYLTPEFYQGYYNKFIKDNNENLSLVANYNAGKSYVSFYSEIIDREPNCSFKGDGVFEDGHLVVRNEQNKKLTLTMFDNHVLVNSDENFCKKGSLNGVYTINSDLTYVITRNSIGNIRKEMSPNDIVKLNPDLKMEQDKDRYIFSDKKGVKLFSIKFENGSIKDPEIFTGLYKTPQGISHDNIYKDVKKYISVDKVWEEDREIKVLNDYLNIIFIFDKNDLRDQNFNVNSIKDTAHIKSIKLAW